MGSKIGNSRARNTAIRVVFARTLIKGGRQNHYSIKKKFFSPERGSRGRSPLEKKNTQLFSQDNISHNSPPDSATSRSWNARLSFFCLSQYFKRCLSAASNSCSLRGKLLHRSSGTPFKGSTNRRRKSTSRRSRSRRSRSSRRRRSSRGFVIRTVLAEAAMKVPRT